MAFSTDALLRLLPLVISVIGEASKIASSSSTVPKYLDMLALLVGKGAAAYDELVQLKDLVVVMVQEKRDPTDDEWAAMQARSDIASERIQSYDFDAEEPIDAIIIGD